MYGCLVRDVDAGASYRGCRQVMSTCSHVVLKITSLMLLLSIKLGFKY